MSGQILGAQYYRPPNPPRSDWNRDLGRMRDAGLTTVKYWACWSWMGASPGSIDFADLDELMDLAHRHDLGVVVNTILENAPYRLEQRWPEARYLDHQDRPVALTAAMNTPGGGWPGLCFDHPGVWEAAAEFLRAVVARYRGHPALRVWDVWNEPHLEPTSYFPERLYCYCPASLERFRSWLRDRYPTLSALNAAWARRFTDWAQVAPPRVFEAVPDMLDWRRFWFDNLTGWLARRASTVRAADAGHPVMSHVALSGFTGRLATHTLDEYALTEPVDIFGTSSFPTWLMADDHVEHLFNLDTARGAAGPKPFWQAELQGGRGRRDGRRGTGHPSPDIVKLWIWNSLAAGASGVMFWQWRPELLGPESPGYGLCTPAGDPGPRVCAVAEIAPIATHPALAGRVVEPPDTALLVSRRTALHAFATDRTMDLYRDAVLGAYRLLLDAGVTPTVLHEDQVIRDGVLAGVTRVYWPMPAVSDAPLHAELTAFVEAGGHLVAEAAPGEYAPSGGRRPVVPGGGLAELFGVRQIDADAVTSSTITLADGGELQGDWQCETLEVVDAVVLGTFSGTGSAAVTRRVCGVGTGSATLIGSYPSLAYAAEPSSATRAAVAGMLGADHPGMARLATWDTPQPGLINRNAQLADRRRAVFLINWTDDEQACRTTVPMAPLPLEDPPKATALPGSATTFTVPPRSGLLLVTTGPH
jgi:beta-galactosidase GanA